MVIQWLGFRSVLFLVFLILIDGHKVIGQGSELETLGPDVRWRQIKTENFNILYPEDFEKEAQRTANILETIHEPGSQSLGKKPRRFSVLLQSKSAFSNGFVTIAPRRSEFFTTAPQNYNFIGNADWLQFLATHEFRHMVQFNKAYTGIGKPLYWLFGEYGLGISAALGAPNWFWEGDAVGLETAFTASGRGRIPNFTRVYRANLLEKGAFNYYKQHHQSFKEFVPNHYLTGYIMTTHFKRKYGVDIWDKIVERSFKFPFIPFSFSNAIKAETGRNLLQSYSDVSAELDSLYAMQVKDIAPVKEEWVVNTLSRKVFTNYKYPTEISDGRIVALRAGLGDISEFVAIDQHGKEEVLFTPGIVNDQGYLSIKKDKIVWLEYEFDPRWFKQSYSVIKTYDIENGEYQRLTKKSKYTAVGLSNDGTRLVTVQNDDQNRYTLHILDSNDGSVIKQLSNPDNSFYSMPVFSSDDKRILALKVANGEKFLVEIDLDSGKEKIYFQSKDENFGHPVDHGNYIFYNTPYNGIDNIHAFDKSSGLIFQITSSRFGAYYPSISHDGKYIIYNDHQQLGMDVIKKPLNKVHWRPLEQVKDLDIQYAKPMVDAEGHSDIFVKMDTTTFVSRKYNKWKGIINPYAWGLSTLLVNNTVIIGLNSQDVLSTTAISGGLLYSGNERNWLRFGSISYQGLYPIIDLSAVSGTRSTDELIDDQIQPFDWHETSMSVGLRVPFLLTNSKYLRKLNFQVRARRIHVSNYDNPVENLAQPGNGNTNSLEYRIEYTRGLKVSKRDLYSKFGQTLQINYKHTPIGGNYFSKLASIQSNLFFPGFVKHHSLRVRGTYQYEDKQNYRFSSPVTFTRGFGYISFDHYVNWSLNYAAPIWHPDIHLGPFVNIQRIYANVFYDRGKGIRSGNDNLTLQSYGMEISSNFNLMRFNVLFDMGIRYSILPDFDNTLLEIIIGRITF